MKRTFIAAIAATVPVAALAIGSAMAQPPKATTTSIVSYASFNQGVRRPDWHLHLISPVVVVVSDKVAPSGLLAATPGQAANLLDS